MSHTYAYPRPAVTVDCALFGYDHKEGDLRVLLIERGGEPFAGCWALPGGFVDPDESAEDAARRELEEETSVEDVYLEQLYTFSKPGRDPRGHVISIAHFALVNRGAHAIEARSDARRVAWFTLEALPKLAFDHGEILETALGRLRSKVIYAPIGFELLPPRFALRDLQRLYETILGGELDKSNFRKRILKTGVIVDTGEKEDAVSHRPASLFELDKHVYEKLMREGYPFEL